MREIVLVSSSPSVENNLILIIENIPRNNNKTYFEVLLSFVHARECITTYITLYYYFYYYYK
jgi:hypothetical protein